VSEITDDLVIGEIAETSINSDNGGAPAGRPPESRSPLPRVDEQPGHQCEIVLPASEVSTRQPRRRVVRAPVESNVTGEP
jgi:hypothetical protein